MNKKNQPKNPPRSKARNRVNTPPVAVIPMNVPLTDRLTGETDDARIARLGLDITVLMDINGKILDLKRGMASVKPAGAAGDEGSEGGERKDKLYSQLLDDIRASTKKDMKIEFVLNVEEAKADISEKDRITCQLDCASGNSDNGDNGCQIKFNGFEVKKNNERKVFPINEYQYAEEITPIKNLGESLSEIFREIQRSGSEGYTIQDSINKDSVIFMLAEAARSEPCREAAKEIYNNPKVPWRTIENVNSELGVL